MGAPARLGRAKTQTRSRVPETRARIPEKRKIPGVCYAVTDDGLELPVVDLTHPAFAFDVRPEELPGLLEASLRKLRLSWRVQALVGRLVARRSILVRAAMSSGGRPLSALATYLYKLGPDNLGRGYAGRIDRAMCRSIVPVAIRMRLAATARLLAEGLAPALRARRGRPLRLLNIGGGAAADSLNALLLLRRQDPQLLADRAVAIHVLDLDGAGPGFAGRALQALSARGAPLQGLGATLEHVVYDWDEPAPLLRLLGRLAPQDVVACSSEGALLEYGSDGAVVANLEALRAAVPGDCHLVGSAARPIALLRVMQELSGMPIRLRDEDGLGALVERAGWTVAQSAAGNPVYQVVDLLPATRGA